MELKDQVCSYNQAVKLKRLISAESYFSYVHFTKQEIREKNIEIMATDQIHIGWVFPAYTVAELIEILPAQIDECFGLRIRKRFCKNNIQYNVGYLIFSEDHNLINRQGINLAATLSDVLIWLIENKHINPEDLK